jgi:predicted phage terminase large subunit-like protein|tara:strand:+ start:1102 stop:2247 length:1146 start_codon:yes stop_codon:yes gene_type:complete
VWLILAGRGWGKTLTGAMDALIYALKNPESQVAVVTPTFGDIRRVAFGGVSGMLKHLPRECLKSGRGQGYNASASEIRLYNGSKIMGFSATEPDRLRGPQFHRAWCDELAAWQYPDTFDQLQFGLRLGDKPQCVITTTPKPIPMIRDLAKRANICITRGSTFENAANLAPSALAMLEEKYSNTRLGRQELYAEIIDDIEGALWSHSIIEDQRVTEAPEMQRIVVSIDPAVTSGENSDETGIIISGRGVDNRYYVIDDISGRMSPDAWAQKAVNAYHEHDADKIVAEVNNGGDLVERLIRTVESGVPYKAIRSSRGKLLRAEPISALYEQGKVSHLGVFSELEQQMCGYTPETAKSPDRLDALVFGITELSASSGQAMWRVS